MPPRMSSAWSCAPRFGVFAVPVLMLWVGEQQFFARAVILAMGSGYRKLGLPNEDAPLFGEWVDKIVHETARSRT